MSAPASQVCTRRVVVRNALGLYARPAAMLAKTSQKYDAQIVMECGRKSGNAKSIGGILMLCARQGSIVTVTAEGSDAYDAVHAVEGLFASSFHNDVEMAAKEYHGMEEPFAEDVQVRYADMRAAVISAVPG